MFKPLDAGKVKDLEAELKDYDDKSITVILENEDIISIERSNLALVRLAFEF